MVPRRRILLFAVGMIGALGGSAMTTYLRGNHCLDAGGSWNLAKRTCTTAVGMPLVTTTLSESMAGIAVTIVLAIALYQGVVFMATRSTSDSRR